MIGKSGILLKKDMDDKNAFTYCSFDFVFWEKGTSVGSIFRSVEGDKCGGELGGILLEHTAEI